jgi:tight adherence protein C
MAAFQCVTDELQLADPELGLEFNVVQREIQMGLSPTSSLRKFADRCGLAEVRDLASNLAQAERVGASLAKMLRTYTDTARQERQQAAEECAQKMALKILFPTLVFIVPAIFVVLLGPAALQMAKLFPK